MLRGGFLLFCLLVSSLLATTTIHARETPYAPTMECSGAVHHDGDADQSSGDADRAVPHHHGGCHGHHISLAAGTVSSDAVVGGADLLLAFNPVALAHSAVDPALRPPIA